MTKQLGGKGGNGFKPGKSGNPKGRPKGAPDRIMPRGSVRAAFLDFLKHAQGREKMVKAINAAITGKGKLALGYMRLAAQVIDRVDHERKMLGGGSTIVFNSPLNPMTLRMGLPATGIGHDDDEDPDDE